MSNSFLEPPMFVMKLKSTKLVVKGSAVKLVCKATELKPKWFKDGVELSSGQKYNISFSKMISSLKVLSAERIDMGEYTFEVKNEVGSDLTKLNLTVLAIGSNAWHKCNFLSNCQRKCPTETEMV
uniref:Ig-like domain-containing protein n=1 Tax=Salmo trutta TaxID=8032 RepID=A0A674F453_SALTR